ncbi:OmpA family protein [Paracoccus sp. (in: a-proteobacteria)]|uniref:OmpA family protein n=1 Tax=Paracoccus sp. TaxID=267 RepID=UPI003A89CA7A
MRPDRLFAFRHDTGCLLTILAATLAGNAAHAAETPAIPTIPAIVIPAVIGVEPVQESFETALGKRLAQIDGLRVEPARCDADGAFVPGLGMVVQDDAGVTANLGDEGQYVIDRDGSGIANLGTTQITVQTDGSGTINRQGGDGSASVQITVEANGAGTNNGPLGQIMLDGQGGGTWNSDRIGQISVEADGSGTWNGAHRIVNNGDGTGIVDGQESPMDALPPVPPAGRFPLLTTFRLPPMACGYVITLNDSILFDFDKSDLREDAAQVVDALSAAFVEVAPKRPEIRGHIDSKGSAEYNQDLSERRAAASARSGFRVLA